MKMRFEVSVKFDRGPWITDVFNNSEPLWRVWEWVEAEQDLLQDTIGDYVNIKTVTIHPLSAA